MIYIKRSVDSEREVTWIAGDLDEATRRGQLLYIGTDVNGAIAAAVKAGLDNTEAHVQAQAEINRCQQDTVQDTIAV